MTNLEDFRAIRILIADDHPVVRHGIRSLLAGHPDLEVVGEAEDGTEIMPRLTETQTDVILLDIKMQVKSGIEAARQVSHSFPKVKIIILTTYDDESYLQQALEAGVHGYLLKSESHENLAEAIRAVMAGERLLSPSLVSTVLKNYQIMAQEQARQQAGLTSQDLELLECIAQGASTRELAKKFYWSEATVKRKIQEILEKLGASNRPQAIAEAVRRGWI